MSRDFDQRMFACREHQFVIVVTGPGVLDCHGTPGHRVTGCPDCDRVVSDAFDYAGIT